MEGLHPTNSYSTHYMYTLLYMKHDLISSEAFGFVHVVPLLCYSYRMHCTSWAQLIHFLVLIVVVAIVSPFFLSLYLSLCENSISSSLKRCFFSVFLHANAIDITHSLLIVLRNGTEVRVSMHTSLSKVVGWFESNVSIACVFFCIWQKGTSFSLQYFWFGCSGYVPSSWIHLNGIKTFVRLSNFNSII